MSNVLHANYANITAKHESSILSSLEHRLEVAKAACNLPLIELLEHEKKSTVTAKTARSVEQPSLWHRFVENFVIKAELQVKQINDVQGDIWWYAYDPKTGNCVYADTDSDLRSWIESNYTGK